MHAGVCEHCGAAFAGARLDRKFCSAKCRAAAWQRSRDQELTQALETLGRLTTRLQRLQRPKAKA